MKRWFAELRRWIAHFRTDQDLEDELKVHLETLTEENLDAGLSLEEAQRRAKLRLGNTQVVVEKVRDREFITLLESWYRDFVLGLRALRKNPVFSLTAILTLTLGIGANTVIFTLLYGLLLRSLPVADAGRLTRIGLVSTSATSQAAASLPYRMAQQLRRQQHSFTDISYWTRSNVTMDAEEGSSRLRLAGLVSGNGFQLLGMTPHLGRLIAPSDDVRGGPPEGWPVVLSYGFWKDYFGGDPNIIGKQIKLSNTMVTIVGVTPSEFRGAWPGDDPKFYLPIQFATIISGKDDLNEPGSFRFVNIIARLAPSVSLEEANAELAVYQKAFFSEFIPQQLQREPYFATAFLKAESARTGLPTFFGRVYATPLLLMQGLVAIVLLLCCVNVGGLMMSQVYTRQQEFAIRTAIGAARWRLIRQYLTESFVIALTGAALGAAAAWYGTAFLLPYFRHPNEGIGMSVQPDTTVFLITGFFAALTTILFGTMPAWRAGAADPGSLLKARTTAGARRQIAGRAFIPIQVALSFVLVALAALLSQSLIRIRGEQTGFELDRVTIQTAPMHLLKIQPEAQLNLYQRMVDRLEQLPGIESAAVTWYTPMTSFQATASFQALADNPNPPEDSNMAYNKVGPGYFRTMKTAILAGREFRKDERSQDVCILNQSAAAYLFPRQQVIGRYVRSTDTAKFPEGLSCRVIGIAQDAKFANLNEAPPRTIYFPVAIPNVYNLVFLINAASKAQAIAAYRTALTEIAPTVPLVLFVTLREQMDAALGTQRAITMMSNFFAALALFLSGLGLYGLLSSSVTQRTGEIGVRMALGAERHRVLRMILSDALSLLGVGVLLGVIALIIAVRFVEKMLYGVSAFDPLSLIAVSAVLTLVALIAASLPAFRAASIDPMQALRAD